MPQMANKERILKIPGYIMQKDRALSLFQSGRDHLPGYSDSPKDSPVFGLDLKHTRPWSLSLTFSSRFCAILFIKKTNQPTNKKKSQKTKTQTKTVGDDITTQK